MNNGPRADFAPTDPGSRVLLLQECFRLAVEAADPVQAVTGHLPPAPLGRVCVAAVGKAAMAMATAAVRGFAGEPKVTGTVVVPRGAGGVVDGLDVMEAGHPIPDGGSVDAAERVLARAAELGPDDLLLALVSGGGSALLSAPAGISAAEKADLNGALLRSGASIEEINVVRKHLSRIKGGHLARAAYPARVVSLILSDVVGDDLSSVASGPTVADPSTYADALDVLDRYALAVPAARRVLEDGADGKIPETPKPGDPVFDRVENILAAGNGRSLEAAARLLAAAGYAPHLLSGQVTGEAREAGAFHAAIVRQILADDRPFRAPCALLSGGETTVSVRGSGRGGRNSEFALGLALALPEDAPVHALVADSDGRDGSESNAGVLITPRFLRDLDRRAARRALAENDSYSLFAAHGCLVETGPTGTNVNDLRFVLVDRP